jgi:Tfp pilus assembly protein PilN
VLGMIEINLLPQEYRIQERTPLGLFLTIVIGISVVGAIGVYEIGLRKELATQQSKNQDLTLKRDETKKEREKVEALERVIKSAEKRQNTIIEISQS